MLRLLRRRGPAKSLCPSEVARALGAKDPSEEGEGWRAWMPDIRQVAGELASAGILRVTQGGKTVAIASARGPIRLVLSEESQEGEASS